MSDAIAVVREAYQIDEAYHDGYAEFSEVQADELDFSAFQESARWANNIAPRLRAAAGYTDRRGGTYTEDRPVAAIRPGCEEDRPADARQTTASRLYGKLVEAYRAGARDAAKGRPADPDRVVPAPGQ